MEYKVSLQRFSNNMYIDETNFLYNKVCNWIKQVCTFLRTLKYI